MSFVNVAPDGVSAAAGSLKSVGVALNSANLAAAASTVQVAAPAADQVSVAVVAAFGKHASEFQDLGAQTVAFHEQFVGALNKGANAYHNADVANAQQGLADGANAPIQALLGQPLVDPAASAAADDSSPLAGRAVPPGDDVSKPVPSGKTKLEAAEPWVGATLAPTGGVFVNSGPTFAGTPIIYGFSLVGSVSAALTAVQSAGAAFTNTVCGGDFAKALSSLLAAPGTAMGAFVGQAPPAWTMSAHGGSLGEHAAIAFSIAKGGVFSPIRPVSASLTSAGLRVPGH